MSAAGNVICWRRLTGLFPSDTPGCASRHSRGPTFKFPEMISGTAWESERTSEDLTAKSYEIADSLKLLKKKITVN